MKSIDTDSASDGPGSASSESESQTRDSIELIKTQLLRYHADIVDDDLRHCVQEWLMEANQVPGGDLDEYVTARLSELRRENAMYQKPEHDDGKEAFPEACSDCEHYGGRCPVLTDNTQRDRRERLMRNANGPGELRNELREYAIDNGCDVLLDVLEKLGDHHEPLLRRGIVLMLAVEERMMFDDGEQVTRLKSALETLDGDPTADVVDDLGDGDGELIGGENGTGESTTVDVEAEMERLTDGGHSGETQENGFNFGQVTGVDD